MVSLGNSMLSAPSIQIMSIARHLERMADHATGIAEDLIFLIEGRNVRHTAVVSDTASRR
ncbi:MAG: hypothetical protein O3B24_02125 [Verrucomicrobia bacterium]|nr:hypothetical protein [Verrucomicrobiota bacterium]